ncbi:hypothetical protein I4U23_006597 [Adineta vaga]|nr:hypothetical protein I4U23_006597 [Adineta vaga]
MVTTICSIQDCKRAATCLCLHCEKNICSKHFNEHQMEIYNELLPLSDRLNELKMILRDKESRNEPLTKLKMWRDKKYEEIDCEYNEKVQEYENKIIEKDQEVSQVIKRIEELIGDGEASFDQIKQLKKEIETMEDQVKILTREEQTHISLKKKISDEKPSKATIQLGDLKYSYLGKVICNGEANYALEREPSVTDHDELCAHCRFMHIPVKGDRAIHVFCELLRQGLIILVE